VKKTRSHVDDLRGASRLAVEATKAVTDLVQKMHHTIGAGPKILGQPLAVPVKLLTAPTYGTIRAVTHVVGATLDVALAQLEPILGEGVPGVERDAVHAALNGVLGDYLKETKNPLAIETELVRTEAQPTKKILVLVHGSSMSDRGWLRRGHDHGAELAKELGYTPVYARYNSGLHISQNGREIAAELERLASTWPVPIEELVLLGHSMGGLVARSACHYAEKESWRTKLRTMISLGSPHHGAPLERGGNWIDVLLGISRYSAPLARLGKIRSAGITDLRFGYVLDEHWEGRDRFAPGRDRRTPLPLPTGVSCFAIAGSTAEEGTKNPPGDGMVPVDSALGRHESPELVLNFPEAHQSIAFGTSHLDLLSSKQVYETVRDWLRA
jgi:pimeloyl-ACP methyl ester carboxylesterase